MSPKKRFSLYRDQDNDSSYFSFASKVSKGDLGSLEDFILYLRETHKLSSDQILKELIKLSKEYISPIPVSIFSYEISPLEALVKYLKENLELSYHGVAVLLNRDDRTIWFTYQNAIKKIKPKFLIKDSKFFVPVSIFNNRKFSILELLVSYLKEKISLKNHEIASLLNKNPRTIWTVYSRFKLKQK